ncbi:uncharacterized protein LODBEIA_P18400 [Lodderomyces beijingensis]|uniref:ATP-dependent helicase FUN30 n=1 Tax=Lodderomyces beijingensis TaxID=1775926 RepID=A0ABP0ZHI0_9ASCO
MSWYKPNNGKLASENSVQVPSTSPVRIPSSPSDAVSAPRQPSLNAKIDEARQRELERKREKIRAHKDFPMVRRRFDYLGESEIFKGFIKGNGVLRDITKWLEENYSREEFMRKQRLEKEQWIREENRLRQKQREERLRLEYEALSKDTKPNGSDAQPGAGNVAPSSHHDEDDDDENDSPVKMKGKARVKLDPPAPTPVRENNNTSTKVEIKSKSSILNKYRNPTLKPQHQPTSERFGRLDSLLGAHKKRKLVRGSALESAMSSGSESSSPITAPNSLSSKFSFREEASPLSRSGTASPLDELEEVERRIQENNKKARLQKQQMQLQNQPKKQQLVVISDDEEMLLEEEEEDNNLSDSMSDGDGDVEVVHGLTSIDDKILEFLNTAVIEDIIDLSGVEPQTAEILVSQRPFNTIYDISENSFTIDESDKKSRKKKLGLRIVEQTESSLKGYKAIDSLVKKCSEYGNTISTQMKHWGVTETGADGELDMVELNPADDDGDGDVAVVDLDKEEADEDSVVEVKKKGLKYIKSKPSLLKEEVVLNNYQQVGLNWLNLLYHNKLSCILADEMGLGKTCQVIAFMAHLKETGEKHPHLVVVPASTIENWIREFEKFCPEIRVQAYYGSQKEREELRYELQSAEFDVLVTTYSMACGSAHDAKFLKNQDFNVVVYDEGHLLKSSNSERYAKLMRLKGNFRLLLTGTPLQNNLKELVSLLAFILPGVFNDKKEDLAEIFKQKSSGVTASGNSSSKKDYNPLLSVQAIKNAKTMMTPFVLRRRKDQVLQNLPAKKHEICHCKLTLDQERLYNKFIKDGRRWRAERERRRTLSNAEVMKLIKEDPIPTSSNVLMQLRKAALHPLLFRVIYDDKKLKNMAKAIMGEPEYMEANQTYIYEDMTVMSDFELHRLCMKFPHTMKKWNLGEDAFLDSGKVKELDKLLESIIDKKGEKVLIFSLFTQVLDILEYVLSIFKYKFVRLDGGTRVEERQDTIDTFYHDDTIPIFLLSTKAGGFGINLVAANNVIIFDQSFNPHDDKQAEDRAHRVGQTKEVVVYKLICDNTVETNILMLAENKLQLDQTISGEVSDAKLEENAASTVEKILFG